MLRDLFDLFFSRSVTRDRLGHLGGNPHFIPPPRNVVNDSQHGIPPGSEWTKDDPAVSSRNG